MTQVLIVDDHAVLRKGLVALTKQVFREAKVEEAADGPEALARCLKTRHDLVLLDISMPGMGGMDTLKEMTRLGCGARVLMLSMYDEEEFALRALKAGAMGYLTKNAGEKEMEEAMRRVAGGRRYLTPALAERLANQLVEGPAAGSVDSLSDREHQIFILLREGRSIKEIARTLGLDPKTVYTHRDRIRRKLAIKADRELRSWPGGASP